ncbi:hypothetical protein JYG23_09005 [Sedimentibacter sp. zth1]|uniref:Flp1 family type IVb pilin n=1 Tax=Sedimentibacter sp. zth1 TaxID=2816908 RepID=UPI001A928348|nr:Flp1 family type IVb pilin [Sedimentibacter sp. zth1]QSX04841.1 hypothetical protein JYG23_09005 [Sedimentibacter sp. zth1]
MLKKLKNCALATYLKAKNGVNRLIHEEKGAAEVIAILLIIIILIAVIIIFRNELMKLINKIFGVINTDADELL